ncbi:hypothetical protein [Salibacter halophilus]|uniref:Glyoxalase n=1 Tax=Salibacter halophilus TaxID=1803916 RepID=A0A6N6M5L5_9FLAO|nr:hypothetical protein [Salibacter halophilus]KAB1063643.1 hypothetical protein F3059_08725 [Salibacter halophilus]
MKRDNELMRIRGIESDDSQKDLESFIEMRLRPTIVFQKPILISLIRHYVKERKTNFNAFNQKVQKNIVKEFFQGEKELRKMLIQSVIGLFTINELETYYKYSTRLDTEINDYIKTEIVNNIEQLY